MVKNLVKISIVAIFVIISICCIVSDGEKIIDYSNITYEQVELQTLFDDLDKNAFTAKENYKNKYVEICGEISTIDASGDYISLRVPDAGLTLDSILCKIYNKELREFVMIHEGESLKDILFWNGQNYTKLKYKDMRNPYTQEIVKPRNLQQKMAFHLLQNQDIKVKTLYSSWGGGKTLLALTYALEQIAKDKYQKLIFIRNNIIAADTNDIGFLPGTLTEKMKLWGMCMATHVGGEMMLDQLLEEGVIEIFPLSHIRGMSFRDSIILTDECENLTTKHITLLMSRIEENSEIIFCGDMAQVDFKKGEKYSGMNHMINSLAGDPLFGAVKLIKSERGPVPRLCDKISPPNG